MGSQEQALSSSSTSVVHSQVHVDSSVSGLHEKHLRELENLTLTTDPLKTLKYFTLAVFKCLQQLFFGIFAKRGWLMVLGILACGIAIVVTHVGGAHEEHVQELLHYLRFGLWWLALGVVSSIGFGKWTRNCNFGCNSHDKLVLGLEDYSLLTLYVFFFFCFFDKSY
ncbi:hypothetical protein CsSME_00010789 [Camellia sinensis var. sinensis]